MRQISRIHAFLYASLFTLTAQVNPNLSHARALQQSGNLAAARSEYQNTLEKAKANRDDTVSAAALAGLAQVDLAVGHYGGSIAESAQALALFRAHQNSKEEARILTTRAQARFFSGDPEGSLTDLGRAVDIARQSGDREGEITRLNNIGNVYYSQGRYSEALRQYQVAQNRLEAARGEKWFSSRWQLTAANMAVLYQRVGQYHRALQLYTGMGASPQALPTSEQAQMLSNMGTLYRRLGDPVKAIEMYRAAQSLYHQSSSLQGEVGVLNNIGIAQTLDFKYLDGAANTFTEALLMAEKSGSKQLRMTSRLYRGEALLRAGKLEPAAADFAEAGNLASEVKAGEEKWKADYGLARVADRNGDLARSNHLLRGCVDTIERIRKNSSTPSGRTGFLLDRSAVYDLLIEHEAAGRDPNIPAIFALMEQSRARNLQDRVRPRASGLEDLRSRVPPDTLLLEYWRGEHSIAVVWISHEHAGLVYHAVSEPAAMALLDLPVALADPRRQDWESLSRTVRKVLLDGVNAISTSGLKRVIVVPDGELARIPFEVLPASDGIRDLLIDRVSVSYLPFGSEFRERVQNRRLFPPWKKTLMAFADPASNAPGKGLSMTGGENQRLPHAEAEVKNAANIVGGRSDLHFGHDARKQYLYEASSAPIPVLHFATHAFADPEDPERSYILLSPAQPDQGFDYLFLKEAGNLPAAKGSLVTVSACDSGSGKFTRGDGIESFGSTFLAAGAQAVLTSLWRIGDRPSAELMSRFYEALADGKDAADALREAKLAFHRSGASSAHPSYWAAFVLTGDGDKRIPRVLSWKLVAAASILAVSLSIAAARSLMRLKRGAGTG